MADLLLLSREQLARRIIAFSLRTNELSNGIKLSKDHVERIKNESQKSIRLEKLAAQTRLKEQRTHYEDIVTRHQGFIEQVSNIPIHCKIPFWIFPIDYYCIIFSLIVVER